MDIKKTVKSITSWSSLPALLLLLGFTLTNILLMNNFLNKSFLTIFMMTSTPTICVAMGLAGAKISGGIDISLGSLLSLVNVTVAVLCDNPELSFKTIVLIGLAIGLAGGALNGLMVGIFRITPLLATFATNSVFGGLALWILPSPGGFNVPGEFIKFYNSYFLGIPMTIFFILVPLLIWLLFSNSKNGIYLYAIGRNEQNAYLSGINVAAIKFFVYLFGGLCAGIGGLAVTGMIASGDPLIGVEFTMTAIAAIVIGGIKLSGGEGDIWGAIFGVLFLSLILITVVSVQIPTFAQDVTTSLILYFGLVIALLISNKRNKSYVLYGGDR